MNKLWKDHILVDFKYSTGYTRALLEVENPQLLFEKFGQIPGFEEIVAQNWKKFDKERLASGNYQIVPLTAPFLGPNCYIGCKYFPEGLVGNGDKGVTRYYKETTFEGGKGDHIKIFLSLEGSDMYSDFCRLLSHELLHIYDWCKRYEKIGKGKEEDDVSWRPSYNEIRQLMVSSNKVERVVGSILYILYPGEQNAFLSQMKQELEQHKENLNTPANCQKAIEQTTYYRYIDMVKRWIRDFTRLPEDERREKFISSVNSGLNSNFTTYNKALKRIASDADKAEKKLQSIAGKLCYDIYTSYILKEFKDEGGYLHTTPEIKYIDLLV